MPAADLNRGGTDRPAGKRGFGGQLGAFQMGVEDGFKVDRTGVQVREQLEGHDVTVGYMLQPDGLPDAGCTRVVAAMRMVLGALLAARLQSGAVVVLGADGHGVLARLERFRDVQRERRVAAPVLAGRLAVDPDFGLVVDRAEMQQDSAACPIFREAEHAPVPDRWHEIEAADAGQGAFGAEGHQDGIRKGLA